MVEHLCRSTRHKTVDLSVDPCFFRFSATARRRFSSLLTDESGAFCFFETMGTMTFALAFKDSIRAARFGGLGSAGGIRAPFHRYGTVLFFPLLLAPPTRVFFRGLACPRSTARLARPELLLSGIRDDRCGASAACTRRLAGGGGGETPDVVVPNTFSMARARESRFSALGVAAMLDMASEMRWTSGVWTNEFATLLFPAAMVRLVEPAFVTREGLDLVFTSWFARLAVDMGRVVEFDFTAREGLGSVVTTAFDDNVTSL